MILPTFMATLVVAAPVPGKISEIEKDESYKAATPGPSVSATLYLPAPGTVISDARQKEIFEELQRKAAASAQKEAEEQRLKGEGSVKPTL